MTRQRHHILLRGITLLGLLLSTFLVPGKAQAPDTPPSLGEAPTSLPATCGPQVYFDIYHDAGDSRASTFTALVTLITDGLEGTFQEKNQVITDGALANYNVLVIADPEYVLSSNEIAAINRFVAGGGRLIILGEWYPAVNTAAVNALLAGVGANIQLNADEVIDPTDNEAGINYYPLIHQFAPHPLASEVGQSVLYASASLSVEVPALPIATGDDDTYVVAPVTALKAEGLWDNNGMSGLTDTSPGAAAPEAIVPGAPVVMAYSAVGAGSVFVTGDSSLWSDADSDGDGILALNEYDNRTLAHNVFDYPRCPEKRCYRILFDETHGWGYDGSVGNYTIEAGFSKLAEFLRRQGHEVASLQDPAPIDYATLRWYDVLVLMLPKEPYSQTEKEAIAQFVNEGGRLVTISEWGPFAGASPVFLNEVHTYLGDGLIHNADTVYDPTDYEVSQSWPIIHNFAPDPANHGVSNVVEYAGASLQVSEPAHGTAFGDDDTYVAAALALTEEVESSGAGAISPQAGEGRAPEAAAAPVIVQARAEVGAGDVYAIGDANLWDYGDYDGDGIPSLWEYDNARLAHNVFANGQVCQGRPNCHRILFDETHGWATDAYVGDFTIEQGFSDLAALLRGYGHVVDALQDPAPFDFATLQQYDVLVLMLPQQFYTLAEQEAIGQFVNRGGRLVTIGEHAYFSSVSRDILNDLHSFLGDGLSHNADMVFDPTDYEILEYWPIIHTFAPDAVNQGVGEAVEYLGSSLGVQKPAYGTAFGDADTYTGVLAADRAAEESGAIPSGSLPAQAEKGWMEQIYTSRPVEGETNGPFREVRGSKYVYHGPQASAAILIFASDPYHAAPNTFLDQALQALGLSYTAYYSDFVGFETALTAGGPWDLVLFESEVSGTPSSLWAALNNYVLGGGKLILNDWSVLFDPGNPLWATLGFEFVSNDTDPPDPVYWWKPAHPFFNTPQSVPEFTTLTASIYGSYGQHVRRLPGFEALAGYTTPGPDPDQAALIVGNEGRTVFKGFLDGQNDANLDGDALLDGVELWINLIHSMLRVTVQARSQVGAGDVYAIGDANLWNNPDYEEGILGLSEKDNTRLAHNVFGFGELCEGCRVALFKDRNPWGIGPTRALTSQAAPGSELDESQLDAAGNLPEGAARAPAAPLAPEALGDVLNSFLAPPGAQMVGLEWVDGYLWASGWDSVLYKLDPANGAILETIPVPGVFPCGLAWDGSTFWISDCNVHRLVQVDLTGAVLRSFPSPGPDTVGVAWDGTALWDVDWVNDQLHRIDPFSGAVLNTIPAPDTRAAGVAWDGRYLWTNGRDSALTYKLDPDTGAVVAYFNTPPGPGVNNGQGAAFDGIYLWVANFDNGMIYQIDVAHVGPQLEPNEQVLRRWGIPYDIYGSADMGEVNLQPYCKVVVASVQPHAFYQTLSNQRAWFEAWIEQGGMFELNGASYSSDDWGGLPMPGGFTSTWEGSDNVTIRDTLHPILRLPNTISGAELDGWNWSTHGYLVDLPFMADNIIAFEPSGEPATTEFHLERGCVLATEQTLEWAWYWRYSPLLENMILYRRCQPFLIYLPLVVKNAP